MKIKIVCTQYEHSLLQWPLIDGLIKSDVLSQWPTASQAEKRRILRTLSDGWERNEIAVRAGNTHCSDRKCSVVDHEHGALGPLVPHEGLQAALVIEHQAAQQRSHGVWREDDNGEEPDPSVEDLLVDSGDSDREVHSNEDAVVEVVQEDSSEDAVVEVELEESNDDAVDEVVLVEMANNLERSEDEMVRGAVNASLHPQEHDNDEQWEDLSDEDGSDDEGEGEETNSPPAAPVRPSSGHNLPGMVEQRSGLARHNSSAARACLFNSFSRSKSTSSPSGPSVVRTPSSLGGRASTKAVVHSGMQSFGTPPLSSRAPRNNLRITGRESRTKIRGSQSVREERRTGSAPAAAPSIERRPHKRSRENESPAARGQPARSARVPPVAAVPSSPGAAPIASPPAPADNLVAAPAAAPSSPPALPPAGPSAPARAGQLAGRERRARDRGNNGSSSSQGRVKKTSKRKK